MASSRPKPFSAAVASAMLDLMGEEHAPESEESFLCSDEDPEYVPPVPDHNQNSDLSDEEGTLAILALPAARSVASSTQTNTTSTSIDSIRNGNSGSTPLMPDQGYNDVTDIPASSATDLGHGNHEHGNSIPLIADHGNNDVVDVPASNATDLEGHGNHEKLTRKRKRNPSNWKRNVAKARRQTGQEYTSTRCGKCVPSRTVKTAKDCSKCKYKCTEKISEEERQNIHSMFWSLNDEGKYHFYSEYTERVEKARCRGNTNTKPKTYTYNYFLRSGNSAVKERVCKTFFLTTLDVSKMRISYFYTNKRCVDTGLPLPSISGKYPKKKTSNQQLAEVRNHIDSFPRIPSHYCRDSSSREYLEKHLNVTKMYGLYKDWCAENDTIPVKEHKYAEVFKTEFNIGFMAPKKDRCDKCELGRLNKSLPPTEQEALQQHNVSKQKAYCEREKDRNDKTKPVVCFDLENVFSLPISGVSNFFYKRKLCTFNMTAHLSLTKKSYFAVWHEGDGGRTGNNMASAIIKILEQVMSDHPDIKDLTLWSDSCVCQNRNSVMTLALSLFVRRFPNLETITQKFCEAGHSNIQEVDTIHSVIERHLRHQEIYSPLGLVKKLVTIRNTQTIQMVDFFDYQAKAKKEYVFSRVPFTKVRQLKVSHVTGVISFKLDHDAIEWTTVSVKTELSVSTRKGLKETLTKEIDLKKLAKPSIGQAKKADIESMLQYMPHTDKVYMTTVVS